MDPLALLLADSRFPSGSYAHSLGLEQAVNDGLTDVPAFIRARLRLVAAADARFAVEARRACIQPVYRGQTPVCMWDTRALDREWAARTPSPLLREGARRLGAQLLRSAAAVWPGGVIASYRVESTGTPRPIALGVVAAAAGLGDEDVALLALYDDAATVASATLKLLPLDPAVTARWLADLAPQLSLMARSVTLDRGPLPAPAAVAIELAAPIHREQRERLFAS
ncbi:MAG TPA: urease accessory UreF family protein [Solirubrobacter sp.]